MQFKPVPGKLIVREAPSTEYSVEGAMTIFMIIHSHKESLFKKSRLIICSNDQKSLIVKYNLDVYYIIDESSILAVI